MKAAERCRCGERQTQVLVRRNRLGRIVSGLRACTPCATKAIADGLYEHSFDIGQPADPFHNRQKEAS